MEQRPFDHEEEDELDSESSQKKRTSTFSKYLSLLRRKETDRLSTAESDEDEENEKPKRFRSLFSKLFPSIVESSHHDENREKQQFDPENWFNWMKPSTESESSVTQSEETSIETEVTPEVPMTQAVLETTEQSSVEEKPSEKERPEKSTETTPETVEPVSTPEQVPIGQENLSQPIYEPSNDRMVYERPTEQPVEKEVVIERGPGMALPVVLVGAEYLARKKADKKLEKRVNEKIAATNKEVDRSALLQRELETLTQQNQERIEALKRDRGIITAPEKSPVVERAVLQAEKRSTSPETIEKPAVVAPEKPQEQETYKIMEQVAEAAEHNVPVERVFERSHEVKDDQTVPMGATSVGSIMAARAASQQLPNQSTAVSGPTDTGGLPIAYEKPAGDAYRRAMQRGFWSAVIIIIIGTIAYLLK